MRMEVLIVLDVILSARIFLAVSTGANFIRTPCLNHDTSPQILIPHGSRITPALIAHPNTCTLKVLPLLFTMRMEVLIVLDVILSAGVFFTISTGANSNTAEFTGAEVDVSKFGRHGNGASGSQGSKESGADLVHHCRTVRCSKLLGCRVSILFLGVGKFVTGPGPK